LKAKRVRKQPTAEIISIGNELLIGHTLDTNSHWIAKRLNSYGWNLRRVTQLQDSLDSIESGVQESLRRKPAIIITLGGLGPTHDDMTLKGVSRALGKPLRLNREALNQISEHYERLETRPVLTSYRTKMATLPEGSSPIPNPVGTAPGVMIRAGQSTIYSLPGVPSEMKAIFKKSIEPYLESLSSDRPVGVQFKIAGIIESALAPILDQARRKYPGLYFKSHPRGRETGIKPLILLHIYNVQPGTERELAEAADYVVERIAQVSKY
jgi:nicotinamide-nucleotide amidase